MFGNAFGLAKPGDEQQHAGGVQKPGELAHGESPGSWPA
jgi:hypothetical protein